MFNRVWFFFILLQVGCAGVPAPGPVAAGPTEIDYRIQPGDQLGIRFPRASELDQDVVVRSDGRISVALISEIQATGRTPEQLALDLQERYTGQLRNPQVSVTVQESAKRIFVDGQVNRPSEIPWTRPLTVLQDMALAGGTTEQADLDRVAVIRGTSENRRILTVDVNAARRNPTRPDLLLEPGDIVFVEQTGIALVNQWVDQYLRKNLPVSVSIRPGL